MNTTSKLVDGYIRTFGLEFFAVDHCNLKCLGCSQSSPYLARRFADLTVFEKTLRILGKYMRPNKITILGGEPLLHPDIDAVIAIAKESQMFNEIHIATNGLTLSKMSSTFWSNVDLIRISKYPDTSNYILENLAWFKAKCDAYDIKLQIREMTTFNQIILSEEITDRAIVSEIFQGCIYKFYCHNLTEDKLFRCSPVVNLDQYLSSVNQRKTTLENDYLLIEDSVNFRDALLNYLNSDLPLNGCRYCLGSSGKSFPHRQLKSHETLNPARSFISSENYQSLTK